MGDNLCERCVANCRHEIPPDQIVVMCGSFKEITTNADRIRAMSDEELAEHIWKKCGCPSGKSNVTCGYIGNCKDCWVEWLQEPVKEDAK